MSCECNPYSINMGDMFVYWSDILGKPDQSASLVKFVDDKIALAKDEILAILADEIDKLAAKIAEDIKNSLRDGLDGLDAYAVHYKDTNVGAALDTLFDEDFTGTIAEELVYEKGKDMADEVVSWEFNKPLVKQTLLISSDSAPTETVELDPTDRSYSLKDFSDNTRLVITGETETGAVVTLTTEIKFKLRMYYGTNQDSTLTNKQILELGSILVDKDDKEFKHLFSCRDNSYIYYVIPEGMHDYYSFYTNGLKDNTYVWEVVNVTNKHEYLATYVKYRMPIAMTGTDIRSEVYAHETY